MHFLGLLLLSLAKILRFLINFYTILVGASVIISWIQPDPYNPIVKFIRDITTPAFRIARRLLPKSSLRSGFDFTPILIFALLIIVDTVIVGMIFEWSMHILSK